MPYSKDQPYNDLPLLPPGNYEWETLEVYKKLADARAELKGHYP